MHPTTGYLTTDGATAELAIGAYRFHLPSATLLCRSGAALPLGRRARALLSVLAENAGRDVSAAQLLDRVWPGQILDPANVAVQVSGLRAALGDSDGSLILTVHGRGYRLALPTAMPRANNVGIVPHTLTPLSGRDLELANAVRLLRRDRLLVITGLAGTGKTHLACATAQATATDFPDGQWYVGLDGMPINDAIALAERIVTVTAAVTPPGTDTTNGPGAVLAHLGERRSLLLIDSAERLGPDAVGFLHRLLDACPSLGLLLTSHITHEALRRYSVRLSPLALPTGGEMAAPATTLFRQAAGAVGLDFEGDQAAASIIAGICKSVGGVPLGMEMVARAASLLGLGVAAEASRDPMRALPDMRRRGPSRHRSLNAAMGWAVNLLTDREKRALLALASLSDSFTTAEASQALASNLGHERPRRWLGVLHGKSMLERQGDGLTLNPLVRAAIRAKVA